MVGYLTAAGNAAVTLAVGPGIYAHEAAHYLACRFVGLEVYGRPSVGLTGDATFDHEPAGDFWADALVAGAPLVVNSLLAVLAFLVAGTAGTPWGWLALWLGLTMSLTALPSGPDTATLLPGVRTLARPRRPLGYALALPLRAVSASTLLAGPVTLAWTVVLYGLAV